MKTKHLLITFITILTLNACSGHYDPDVLKSRYMDEHSGFLMIDGNGVHYRDQGKGEVIVLIHGTASSLHTWDQWSASLADRYRVVRMDLPGFGLTGPDNSDRYEVADDMRFLRLFLEKLEIESAHLVGSSLGGRIAWQYALEFPTEVESLTLLNALGYPQESWPPPIEMAQWPVLDALMARFSPRFMYEIGLNDVYFDNNLVSDAVVDRYFELSRYPGNLPAFTKRVKARLDQDAHQIKNIAVSTLILWGAEDKYFPVENAYRFNSDIRDSEVIVYNNVGHLPMEESPKQSVNDFIQFLSGLASNESVNLRSL